MNSFFKTVVATFLGSFISFFLIIGILTLGVVGIIASIDGAEEIADQSILELKFDKPIVEHKSNSPIDEFKVQAGLDDAVISLVDIKKTILKAKDDDKIKAILLNLSNVDASYAVLEEICNTLNQFRQSDKLIYSYGEWMSEKAFYLGSMGNKRFMCPDGVLEFNGLAVEIMYFKQMLEKIGVEPKVFKVGKFKSAVEPFLLDSMSAANEAQVSSFLESVYSKTLHDISLTVGLQTARLRSIADSLQVQTVEDARRLGLLTGVAYYDEVIDEIKNDNSIELDEEISVLGMNSYMKDLKSEEILSDLASEEHIAVVVAEGDIVSGKGDENQIGSEQMLGVFRSLRKNDNVKGIVLRINSPGGSALASDVIWREIQKTREVKPVVASMSGVAASGGYYMAMACDTIFAHEHTITGSIGVFGILANLQGLFEEKLGITTDRVRTGPFADLANPFREMTEADSTIIQNGVNRIYESFTSKVAEARNLSREEVEELASGRVWTGSQAVENGLVDRIGSLESAIASLTRSADLTDSQVVYYPKYDDFWGEPLVDNKMKLHLSTELKEYVEVLEKLHSLNGIQARLPYTVEIN